VSPTALIPSLQADALAREIEQQLKDEASAATQAAERAAQATVAQARKTARGRLHEAIEGLRREGERRLMQAKAQLETQTRAVHQRQAATALQEAVPLLREALADRWRGAGARRAWTDTVARLCVRRLRRGAWAVEHPADWSAKEQKAFAECIGDADGIELSFNPDKGLSAGLKVKSDQAMLDATIDGLLADRRTIAGLLLQELDDAVPRRPPHNDREHTDE